MSETLLHRVAHTPLRDIFRFRITGRLDRVSILHASGLPAEVRDAITTVVSRTRLSRLEKADVTRELVAHFADALEAGASAPEAMERFGDVKPAAKLIRRSKLRQRSILWWAWRRTWQTMGVFALVVIGVYAALTVRFMTGTPNVARDYLAELNAPARSVPVTDRAWPRYREARLLLTPVPGELDDAGWFSPEALEDPEVLALSRSYLAANEEAISLLHDAGAAPVLGALLSHEVDTELFPDESTAGGTGLLDASLVSVLVPQFGVLQGHARVLTASAFIAALDGDADQVTADLDALQATGVHCREVPFLLADLVSLAILHLHVQTVGDLLASDPDLFSDEQLVHLGHAIAGGVSDDATRFDWATERLMFDDLLQRVFTDNGAGDGRLVFEGLKSLMQMSSTAEEPIELGPGAMAFGPVADAAGVGRADLVRMADRMYAHAARAGNAPLWEWDAELHTSPIDALTPIQKVRYHVLAIFKPNIEQASFSRQRVLQHRDGVLAAIALELHRRRHGAYPATLESLHPGMLPTLPRDRFDGSVLRYRLVDGRPVLYSVGVNRRDDGGTPAERVPGYQAWYDGLAGTAPSRGPDDWVIWPRDSN